MDINLMSNKFRLRLARLRRNWHHVAFLIDLGCRMADINIVQAHRLAPEQARAAAQQVADKLAEQFELTCAWDGDVLRFERSGVSGSLSLFPDQAKLHIALGFLFGAFSSQIEAKVADKMRRVFA